MSTGIKFPTNKVSSPWTHPPPPHANTKDNLQNKSQKCNTNVPISRNLTNSKQLKIICSTRGKLQACTHKSTRVTRIRNLIYLYLRMHFATKWLILLDLVTLLCMYGMVYYTYCRILAHTCTVRAKKTCPKSRVLLRRFAASITSIRTLRARANYC